MTFMLGRPDDSRSEAGPNLGVRRPARPRGGAAMASSSFTVAARDGTPVATYRWAPTGPVRGAVQIVHGLGEHVRRYDHLANTLAGAGFLVQGHDTRGHGATIADGAEPGVIGAEGWRA